VYEGSLPERVEGAATHAEVILRYPAAWRLRERHEHPVYGELDNPRQLGLPMSIAQSRSFRSFVLLLSL